MCSSWRLWIADRCEIELSNSSKSFSFRVKFFKMMEQTLKPLLSTISIFEKLFETWMEKSCQGFADIVFVAENSGKPVGYITCHQLSKIEGKIDLFGVVDGFQGKGIGKELLIGAINWFNRKNVKNISVVTQGRNVKAQRLYQKYGFQSKTIQLWYHKWFALPLEK